MDSIAGSHPQEALVEVGVYPSINEAEEHGLVALAVGWPYWVESGPGGVRLLVEPQAAASVGRHLRAYARERLHWPPRMTLDPWTSGDNAWFTPMLWSALILALYTQQAAWVEAGLLDVRAVIERGEFWRAATALFLHGSAAHVISNALGGILVFTAVVSTLGTRLGWSLVGASALAANLLMAAAHYPQDFRSLGASTAIFAGVGVLCGRSVRVVARSAHPYRWRAMFAPFAAGITVLALYGAGGEQVDIGAHLSGFGLGLAAGFVFGLRRSPRPPSR